MQNLENAVSKLAQVFKLEAQTFFQSKPQNFMLMPTIGSAKIPRMSVTQTLVVSLI